MPGSGVLFLAVPDGAVAEMAQRIARLGPAPGLAVVHVSGSLGLSALDALPANPRGSFHPLQSFPAPRDPSAFRGITVAVDATTPSLLTRLQRLARELGARPRRVTDRERALYHAAAVFASNFPIASIYEGVRLLEAVGWSRKEAERALIPLVDGMVQNLRRRGVVGALTGPLRRGDAGTVRRHLEAVRPLGPAGRLRAKRVKDGPRSALTPSAPPTNGEDPSQLYRMLALAALRIAIEAGLDPEAAELTRRALTRDVAATRRRGRR